MVPFIGIPHESLGEEVKVCVVLKENHTVSETDLGLWTKEHVAAYKYPRHIEFMTALPTTGKILKRKLSLCS
ncbi:AMP-binding enzyme [Chryseolinea lacunae]|uniref:AMP-binding enzyme C-terminal domain-containing protein n=1 Tax=Chryseolinea lacunae TaxID=2801331 RepID=A0ABS1KKJ6_9BACT|nr:hypothetical protein [Chryseolinea lacunae]MBL0739853.1 hypothetical protein [Chryseolinea lacunae]